MQAELRSLFRKLSTSLKRISYLSGRSFVDHTAALADVAGPDADLIRECSRLFCIQVARTTAFEEIADDAIRAIIMKPIDDQWRKVRDRLVKLGGPKTLEGAQGAALILLDQYPEGLEGKHGAIFQRDQNAWLAIQCAQFILASVDMHRCPLLTARTIEGINDRVLAELAQGHEDSAGSGWKLGDPPNDGCPYETRIAPAGARWHRPMRPDN